MDKFTILNPSKNEIERYLKKWNTLENYVLQEKSLNKLFFDLIPNNRNIEDILIKTSTLNDFYSTNIFNIFPIAKHIHSLNIDERLKIGDSSLVNDITNAKKVKNKNYSFATKYCSHHNPLDYPIYDNYVEKVLMYFKRKDKFYTFKKTDLKDYTIFKSVILKFREFYNLENYNLKELDRYLWLVGKEYFPKKYY